MRKGNTLLKRSLALLLIFVLSVALLPMGDSSAKKKKSTVNMKAKKVTVYAGSAQAAQEDTIYFNGNGDIPYLRLDSLFEEIKQSYEIQYPSGVSFDQTVKGNKITWTKAVNAYGNIPFRVIFDFKKNTIFFDDLNGYFRSEDTSLVGAEFISPVLHYLLQDAGSYNRYGKSYTFDLNKYGIKLLKDKKHAYIPLQTFSDIFGTQSYSIYVYNGDCVIVTDSATLREDLQDVYYKAKVKKMSKEYTAFNYGELCLALDYLFGPKESHGIKSFDSFFSETGLKQGFLNQDATATEAALETAIRLYFDDHHCGIDTMSYNCDPDAFDAAMKDSPDGAYRERMNDIREELLEARQKYFPDGIVPYQEVGDTAYITFDDFMVDITQDHSALPTDKDLPVLANDTVRLVQYAVGKITRPGSPVKRVVLDISLNGGGMVYTGCYLLSAILGKSSTAMKDALTGATSMVVKKADTNLDGVFDEKDTVANRGLKFYCLTSGFSYSCANTVASMFKDSGKVTLIGRTTGGGSYSVQYLSTASGTLFQISGEKRFSFSKNGDFYDCDRGAEPDYYMEDMSKIYDRNYMNKYLDKLTSGQ